MHATIRTNRAQRQRIALGQSKVHFAKIAELSPQVLRDIAEQQQKVVTAKRAHRKKMHEIRRSLIGLPPVKNQRQHNRN